MIERVIKFKKKKNSKKISKTSNTGNTYNVDIIKLLGSENPNKDKIKTLEDLYLNN